jgi:hypothetical protein
VIGPSASLTIFEWMRDGLTPTINCSIPFFFTSGSIGVAGRWVVVISFESNHISLWKGMHCLCCLASTLLFLATDIVLFDEWLVGLGLSCLPCCSNLVLAMQPPVKVASIAAVVGVFFLFNAGSFAGETLLFSHLFSYPFEVLLLFFI